MRVMERTGMCILRKLHVADSWSLVSPSSSGCQWRDFDWYLIHALGQDGNVIVDLVLIFVLSELY